MTYREEEILKIALEKGYFDFPKRVKLEQLAEFFGIAPSTLSEILRRGQKKVLEKYFGKA
ncbi:helix-turn-helix domain-containing protein [Archaeoglobus fulgidus]|uniref:helix-turn-helix domain-containing protein n=1 Tax=Archaeoglobus fulgidus TaxID=2234 RepID=UPI0009D70D42|nr:helix-turn-helix domain-containing protein [Archaeoglobus fulgidus]